MASSRYAIGPARALPRPPEEIDRERGLTKNEVALLSVTHPILGTMLEVGAHSIRIGPEQYLGLVDDLCNIVFLAPHLASRVHSLARDLKVPEVAQYVAWMREADSNAAARLQAVNEASQRHSTADTQTAPALNTKFGKGKSHDDNDNDDEKRNGTNADRTMCARDDQSGHELGRSRSGDSQTNDTGADATNPRQHLPHGAHPADAPQHAKPKPGGPGDQRRAPADSRGDSGAALPALRSQTACGPARAERSIAGCEFESEFESEFERTKGGLA